jgi:hypothetical protein
LPPLPMSSAEIITACLRRHGRSVARAAARGRAGNKSVAQRAAPGKGAYWAPILNHPARMSKAPPPKPLKSASTVPASPTPVKSRNPFALNPNYNQQTRKMLGKHYRAKFGVK